MSGRWILAAGFVGALFLAGCALGGGSRTAGAVAKPAVEAAETTTVTSTVERVDRDARQVTLRLPDGTTDVVNVRDPSRLEGVEVGDLVEIAYMRAVSISVEAPAD
jgi:Cu/Ag efflux protein CusF